MFITAWAQGQVTGLPGQHVILFINAAQISVQAKNVTLSAPEGPATHHFIQEYYVQDPAAAALGQIPSSCAKITEEKRKRGGGGPKIAKQCIGESVYWEYTGSEGAAVNGRESIILSLEWNKQIGSDSGEPIWMVSTASMLPRNLTQQNQMMRGLRCHAQATFG